MGTPVKIACCQTPATNNLDQNLEKARQAVSTAAQNGAKVALLPEIFNCPYTNEAMKKAGEPLEGGKTFESLSHIAKQAGISLVAGSIVEAENGNLYNTALTFSETGKFLGKHRKMHLFDVNLEKVKLQESDVFKPGDQLTIFELAGLKVGVVICYDVRFPELIRLLGLKGADLVMVPAAFSITTGSAHWELLLRLRAVDNQLFMAGCSPAPYEGSPYSYYGHSMITSPWGDILAEANTDEDIIYAEIDREKIKDIRARLNLYGHRRTDLYDVSWKGPKN